MFKRLPVMLILLIAPLLGIAQLQLYVSSTGNDLSNASINQPFATVSKALHHVRELRRLNDASLKEGVHIILKGGTYPLTEIIIIRPEDAGTSNSPTLLVILFGSSQ